MSRIRHQAEHRMLRRYFKKMKDGTLTEEELFTLFRILMENLYFKKIEDSMLTEEEGLELVRRLQHQVDLRNPEVIQLISRVKLPQPGERNGEVQNVRGAIREFIIQVTAEWLTRMSKGG